MIWDKIGATSEGVVLVRHIHKKLSGGLCRGKSTRIPYVHQQYGTLGQSLK